LLFLRYLASYTDILLKNKKYGLLFIINPVEYAT